MKLMIRAHDLGVKGEQNIVKRLEELNLDGIQLVAYKSMDDISYIPGEIGEARAKEAAGVLHEKGHEIALLGAYFNPVHPDEEKIKKGIAVFKDYLKTAKAFGCNVVGSETGSYMGEPWVYHPMNHSDEALERVVRKAITEGWEPQGNAQLTCCIMTPGESDRYMCIQAMVRKMK